MPYVLGIHLGGTATSAAIAKRDGSRWGAAAPFPLGTTGPTVPTMLCKVQDGSFVAGEAAQRSQVTHHEWVAQGFSRYVGDDVPLLVGSDFTPAHRLAAVMIEWVADVVAHRLGYPAEHIAVAHGSAWGPHRTHLLSHALGQLGITNVTLLPEPVAVALDYASKQAVEDGSTIVVGNIGGSGFDATVLQHRHPGFEVVGTSLDADRPSGDDLDDEVFELVRSEIGQQVGALDLSQTQDRAAALRLRAECTKARETLSFQPNVMLKVELPKTQTKLGLSRSRFEQVARPHLELVPELLLQSAQSAIGGTDDLEAVVLAGGTARTPMLRQLVTDRLSAPKVDVAPELVAACGAAMRAIDSVSAGTDNAQAAETSVLVRLQGTDSGKFIPVDEDDLEDPSPRPEITVEPMHIEEEPSDRKRMFQILKLSGAAVLIIIGIVLTIHQYQSGSPPSSGSGVLQHQK